MKNILLRFVWSAFIVSVPLACPPPKLMSRPKPGANKAASRSEKKTVEYIEDVACLHQPKPDPAKTYDYIVVGAGPAGCQLLKALSDKDPKTGKYKNVVLGIVGGKNMQSDPLISGGNDTYNQFQGQLTYKPLYARTDRVLDEENGQLLAIGNQGGRNWGGQSAQGDMLHTRDARLYDRLAAITKDPSWKYKNVLPLLKEQEHFYPFPLRAPVSPQRGTHGPLKIVQFAPTADPKNRYIKAISDVTGAQVVPDLDVIQAPTGLGAAQLYNDLLLKRSYGVTAFLNPKVVTTEGKGVNGRKLTITRGKVFKVLFDLKKVGNKVVKKTAMGVEYVDNNGQNQQAFARKGVILSAGIPYSAATLLRSGVGDAKQLKKMGIPVVQNLPMVGKGLKLHYGVSATATGKVLPPQSSLIYDTQILCDGRPFYPADNERRFRILISPFVSLDLQVQTALGIVGLPGITFDAFILEPQSEGEVHIDSFHLRPSIKYNLYKDPKGFDAQASVALFRIIKAIADKMGLQMVYPFDFSSDEALFNVAKATLVRDFYSVRPYRFGTCNMGTSPKNSVVNGKLHVHGIDHLMVADSSIFPIPGGNFNYVAAYLAGRKLAVELGGGK